MCVARERRDWLSGGVYAFGAEGRLFDSTSIRNVGTLGKSFTRNFLYAVIWRPVAALRLNLTSVMACSSYHPFIFYL